MLVNIPIGSRFFSLNLPTCAVYYALKRTILGQVAKFFASTRGGVDPEPQDAALSDDMAKTGFILYIANVVKGDKPGAVLEAATTLEPSLEWQKLKGPAVDRSQPGFGVASEADRIYRLPFVVKDDVVVLDIADAAWEAQSLRTGPALLSAAGAWNVGRK